MLKLNFVITVLVLTGCVQSSDILKLGPDTYSISIHAAPIMGGVFGAEKESINTANQFCHSLGKEILITNRSSGPSSHLPGGTSKITFNCLNKHDPDLKRPVYQGTPNIIIEQRNR